MNIVIVQVAWGVREVDVPVFGVTARIDDLDDDLVGLWLGNGDILDGDRKIFCYLCFLHADSSFWYNCSSQCVDELR